MLNNKPLKNVRVALENTQVAVAEASGQKQSDISRLESKSDWMLSTLIRYAVGLGGHLEVTFVVGNKRIRLE